MRLHHDKLMNICQLSLSMLAGNICQVVVAVYVAPAILLFVVNVIRHVVVVYVVHTDIYSFVYIYYIY